MSTTDLENEVYNATVAVSMGGGDATTIFLDLEMSKAILDYSRLQLERALVGANAAFNATTDEPHERALDLLNDLEDAKQYASVIYKLTPMPDVDEEAAV